ncbi:MAG: ferrous iron transport protein B [Bacteroidales bacterium]|nr:ferrous iron transport protein B [Bacteroidales bacterium]
MTLRDTEIGQSVLITAVGGEGALRQHFLDMGVIPGTVVKLVKYAPMGDPMQLLLHGYLLTLRLDDAAHIEVTTEVPEEVEKENPVSTLPHPGLGEGGRFHREDQERRRQESLSRQHLRQHTEDSKQQKRTLPLRGGAGGGPLTFALAGNQNCGKTTLFNQLTGAAQHVGNFPGVTVDRKSGTIRGYSNSEVTDLPGIYSLSPYTAEEVVSRQYMIDEHPAGIINIVDATNIERNLYLTMQLMELGIPMVLALNMMDEMEGNGGTILVNEMEEALGIPVVPIAASKNQGVDELIEHAVHVARYHETPGRVDFCDPDDHGGAMHRCLHAVAHLIEDHALRAGLPPRFAASKLVEGDSLVKERLHLDANEEATVRHILRQLEEERGLDPAAAIADMRFSFIKDLCSKCVAKPRESKEAIRSGRADRILTGRWTALPSFLAIMCVVFYLTFNLIGGTLQEILADSLDAIGELLLSSFDSLNVTPWVTSLIVDGVWAGVSSVLSFIPIILCLFFFLSLLEDSGYMARIAFVTDMLLRKIGLSGRSIVPMLIGFGCSVPSVMATRTLPSERDRRLTIMLTPFMSCTAKIAIYGFIATPFFGDRAWMVMVGLYLLGITTGVTLMWLAKKLVLHGEAVPFVMELPNYRMPGARNVLRLLWDKCKDFLQKAFTVIFLATIVVWFLQHYDFTLQMLGDEDVAQSILATLAGLVAPIFSPLGFGDWQATTALVTGFIAKENVCAVMTQVYGGSQQLLGIMSPAVALTFLVFCLLYTPCVAAIAAIRRELGGRWATGIVLGQCAIAWAVAFLVHTLLILIL